jgi:hypothetical protein
MHRPSWMWIRYSVLAVVLERITIPIERKDEAPAGTRRIRARGGRDEQ